MAKKVSKAVTRASSDLRGKRSGDAGLALEERRRIKDLEKQVIQLQKNDAAQAKKIASLTAKDSKPRSVAKKKR